MENKISVKLLSMAGQGGSAFGITLMEMMKGRDDIMVLSADMSTPAGLDKFKTAYPDHFMNVGIAEQNMIGIAAGLAEEGYKVICVAQACFITMRCFEQVRQYAGYMGIPMVLVGIGSGLSLQYMGNTHYALEDIALMRMIQGMNVIAPCDSLEAMKALEHAVNNNGSSYIRFWGGTGIPIVHQSDIDFEIGRSITLRQGKDLTLIATGSMVSQAMKVAETLDEKNINATVVDMHTLSSLDTSVLNNEESLIVSMEEHRTRGGLGNAIEERLASLEKRPRLMKLGIEIDFPMAGSYQYMLTQCELQPEIISNRIINIIK